VIAWQRRRFREHWARLSRARPGKPAVDKAVQDLIRKMSTGNPRWGSPRIVGELAKLGIRVAKSTVEKCMIRPRKPRSPTWLDHVIALNERHLWSVLGDYLEDCHRWRCHRSLAMDCPAPRPVQGFEHGHVLQVPEAGGLYRHHERRAV
jgi:hypothetical protein